MRYVSSAMREHPLLGGLAERIAHSDGGLAGECDDTLCAVAGGGFGHRLGPGRSVVTGPHPDWRSRAVLVDHYGWYVAELVSSGGNALGQLLGREFFDHFQETFRALVELHRQIPLDDIARGKVPPVRLTD
jgi:hypothetical protein